MHRPHDVPTVTELIEAVREWLADAGTGDAVVSPFHARVAANVLATVERELELGPEHDRRHADRLARLGVGDDAELAHAIREGGLDDRLPEVRELVWASVRDKLEVANPRYLSGRR
jgi:Domain of unknown function (DUF6285)